MDRKISQKLSLNSLSSESGVYLFKDKNKNVLYVGKAINIKNRVKSHFREKNVNNREAILLKKTKKIDHIVTNSELESLLLEVRLIKQYRPKYNIRLKDDKRYLYVGFTREKYPRVFLFRQPEKEEKLSTWFGPFPTAQSLREILRLLRRVFPYRSCQKIPKKPCLYLHLNLCPGMCIQKSKDYNQTIRSLKIFFNDQTKKLLKNLKQKMIQASKKQKYEQAALFKKQIQMIENLWLGYKKFPDAKKVAQKLLDLRKLLVYWQGFDPIIIQRLEVYDVANLGKDVVVASMVVFTNGEPDHSNYRQFKIKEDFQGDPPALKEAILRRLNHPDWVYPQLLLVDGGKPQVSAAFEALKEKGLAGEIGLIGLAKKREMIVIPKIKKQEIVSWRLLDFKPSNLVLQLLQQARDESHRFAQRYYKKLHKKLIFSGPTQK